MKMLNFIKSFFGSGKGISWLIPVATGAVGVIVGVTLMYLIPPYLIDVLNQTGLFTDVSAANTAIAAIQGLGFFVVVISMIWLVIGVISGGGKRR